MNETPIINPSHQLVIIARLAEFCRYQGATLRHERDPWDYMLRKLQETAEPIAALKESLLNATRARLLEEVQAGGLDAERCSDYRMLFERLLSPGDFADVAIHLTAGAPNQAAALRNILSQVRATNLFLEEGKAAGQRSPSWDKLVGEMNRRLGLDRLGDVLGRKPRTDKRKAVVLRRVRSNVAEYCSVVHIPTDPKDTFTPFMLPRIEAVIAANLRFLKKYR